jgi:hypothetical protein
VSRRASLPGADELFRSTSETRDDGAADERGRGRPVAADDAQVGEASGRVRHDQKITVYLTAQELLDLEQARLRLRAEFDLAVDRGRIVREAVAELLADLHDRGPDAAVVRRLS